MSVAAFALVVLVVFAVATLYRLRPGKVERTYNTIERWRKIIWGVVVIGVTWTFIRSGRPELIALALISVGLAAVYIAVEKPHRNLV
ncbi:hypothetical protein HTZ84_22570 [Haloterrigena sp. SYSU A558-1]|uniref:Uncharacterized protein n=1 Tax=Haloterrigena gelatinilytica TaxID=2741724 RepID=A0ABX2LJJ2_9EURY|nr:hypothetical protein [Haloterrigena gelatinilytica]NUC75053.1 hypothetical protein [Haloterrigena gelatinilytica]